MLQGTCGKFIHGHITNKLWTGIFFPITSITLDSPKLYENALFSNDLRFEVKHSPSSRPPGLL